MNHLYTTMIYGLEIVQGVVILSDYENENRITFDIVSKSVPLVRFSLGAIIIMKPLSMKAKL